MARLTAKQAGILAYRAHGLVFIATTAADTKRVAGLKARGLLTEGGDLTAASRTALAVHITAGLPIDGFKKKGPA